MMRARLLRRCAVTLSILSLLTAQTVQATGPVLERTISPQSAAATIADIALQQDGILQGQLLAADGVPQAGVAVALRKDGRPVAASATNDAGLFVMSGVEAGMYELHTPAGRNIYRVWAPATAPPSAQEGILLVSGQQVVRGQFGTPNPWMQGLGSTLANPWILGLIVAAAIAIPLAIDDDDAS